MDTTPAPVPDLIPTLVPDIRRVPIAALAARAPARRVVSVVPTAAFTSSI